MLLPFPAPSERRGVGEAGPSRCTEEPPEPWANGPRGGGRWGLPGDGGQAALGPAAGGRGEGNQGEGASPRPGQARTRGRARTGPAQQPDPGRPGFQAGNGCSGPGHPAFRLCDCDGPTGAKGG